VRVQELHGFGAAMPVADNASARGRELNPRVEVWWVPAASTTISSEAATFGNGAASGGSVGMD